MRNELVWVSFRPAESIPVAVTVYRCETPRAQVLCQAVPAALSAPVTASPEVRTVTLVSLPSVAVTLIPLDGVAW